MPARKGKKAEASEVADAQTKEVNAPPSKRRAVSEEREELAEVEKESEMVPDKGSKPKRGRGRPKKAAAVAPKASKGPRGRPAKQKQGNKEEKDNAEIAKPRKGRPKKNAKQDDTSDVHI